MVTLNICLASSRYARVHMKHITNLIYNSLPTLTEPFANRAADAVPPEQCEAHSPAYLPISPP